MIGHHVGHRGYDRVGGPAGKTFAEGGRRLLDWFDWLLPAAWKHEHNVLHHYRLNEARDPDLVEANLTWLRESRGRGIRAPPPAATCGSVASSDTPMEGKRDFLLRQVLGSANFRTGGDLDDFAHGYLNYQIEHHLWPDLPMAAYQRAQPRVKAICARHGVPYVQESVWRRVVRTVRVMVGEESMLVYELEAVGKAAPAA